MILQCPGCGTRFLVNAALIPAAGREVKCAKCAHQWLVLPEKAAAPEEKPSFMQARLGDDHPEAAHGMDEHLMLPEDEPQRVDALPHLPEYEPSAADFEMPFAPNVPAVAAPAKVAWMPLVVAAVVLLVIALAAVLLAFRPALQSSLSGVYALMGQPSTEGLALADVAMRERALRNKSRYIVEGHILNESNEERQLPILRISLVDAKGEWLVSREYEAEKVLKPAESFAFKATNLETAFVDRVDHVLVELGNGIELSLRK